MVPFWGLVESEAKWSTTIVGGGPLKRHIDRCGVLRYAAGVGNEMERKEREDEERRPLRAEAKTCRRPRLARGFEQVPRDISRWRKRRSATQSLSR